MSIPSIKTSKQKVFARKGILEVLFMRAYFKQSKINCNAIYWINAVKACFDEHTKNTKWNWQNFVLVSCVLRQAHECRERQLVTITVTPINDNSSRCCYITGMMGLFALDDEACTQNYFLLQFNITGFIRYKLYTYLLCLIKPVTSNKLHWSYRFLHKAN